MWLALALGLASRPRDQQGPTSTSGLLLKGDMADDPKDFLLLKGDMADDANDFLLLKGDAA